MAELKTRPTAEAPAAFVAAIADPVRRADCQQLLAMMSRATGAPPRMWGSSIVGFGSYRYRYASGHEGEWCEVGFSPRKGDLSVYLMAGLDGQKGFLARLGRHKTGKSCLYLKRLADVDQAVLQAMIDHAVAEIRRRHP
ncbi:MAG: DUF1801 domain-containing protein [Rubrivivax sp.]|nr:DUF1801 domain-containing protein [Rubrivivax sp.]